MPSHIGQNGQLAGSKRFIQQQQSNTDVQKEVMEILQNMAEKKHLGWSLARLQMLEKQLIK